MKIICICFVIFSLVSSDRLVNHYVKVENVANQNQLGLFYENIHIENNQLVLTAYLLNGYEIPMYPKSLYLRIFDDKKVYAEDTFLFPNNFFMEVSEIKVVTIRFLMREDLNYHNVSQSLVYYQYYFTENPIEV